MAEIVMAGILYAAGYFDCRTKKIPNWLVVCGLAPVAARLLQSETVQQMIGRLFSMVLVLFIFWWAYRIRGLGAGDVKIFVLLAGLCGIYRLLFILIIAFLSALVYSLLRRERHTVILAPFVAAGYTLVMTEGWWM